MRVAQFRSWELIDTGHGSWWESSRWLLFAKQKLGTLHRAVIWLCRARIVEPHTWLSCDQSTHHRSSSRKAATLRYHNGMVSITDGPFAETKEQLGGILILEAHDLNHAIQLMSKNPGVRGGPFEIRPIVDLPKMVAESERRRSKA